MKGLVLFALVCSATAFVAPSSAWRPRTAAPARAASTLRMAALSLKVGEEVSVISGDEKGKTGKVLKIDKKKKNGPYVLVEGLNIVTKHQKATSREKVGEIIKKEALIHISNLKALASDEMGETLAVAE